MKRFNKLLFVIAISASPILAAEVNDQTAITSLNHSWGNVLNAGKTSDLVNVYTENAVVMPPSSEILSDSTAIRNYWEGLRKVGVNDYVIRTVETRIAGDTAYQTALWEATRKTADGNVILFEGNMSNVLKRQKDGTWKISLQSWN